MTSKNVSIKYVKKQIAKLKHIDLQNVTVEEIKFSLNKLLEHFDVFIRELDATPIFRARALSPSSNIFTKKEEIWYPPAHLVTRLGRLNNLNVSMFYCGSDMHTTIEEVKPQIGDRFVIIECSLKNMSNRPKVVELGVREAMEKYNKEYQPLSQKWLNQIDAEYGTIPGKVNKIIRDFLAHEFVQRVSADKIYKYKMTVAIAELFLASSQVDGFWYASSDLTSSATNLALKPEVVDQLYQLDNCFVVTVKHIEPLTNGAFRYGLWHSHRSERITVDGDIEWLELEDPTIIPAKS